MIKTQVPPFLDIELNTHCNKICRKCFQSFNPLEKALMPFDLVQKILKEYAKKKGKSVKFTFRGEPLLYPQLYDAIKLGKELNIPHIILNTNALLLTPSMANDLIEAGLDEIIYSIDACYPITYEKLQGLGFRNITRNIITLHFLKQLHGKGVPKIRVQACKNEVNKQELENGEYHQFWKDFVDEIVITKEFDLKDQTEDDTILEDFCCEDLFERLVILINGDVLPCCAGYDYLNDIVYSIGNIEQNTIEEIYNSKKLEHLRKLHKQGQSHEIEMCRKCRKRKELIKN